MSLPLPGQSASKGPIAPYDLRYILYSIVVLKYLILVHYGLELQTEDYEMLLRSK